jgi:oxygen-independent coproporphyrinogen-3 oxidase
VIYVHIPFCRSFCTYCDFYSEVAAKCSKAEDAIKQESLFGAFAEALAKETVSRADEISDEVNTLYIGGGTPSVLPLSAFNSLLEALRSVGHNGRFDEFTVEVNPEDVVEKGPGYIEGLMKLGVNRISMGVQSFDNEILRFMNRRHDADTAVSAYAILEQAGVKNISIDLIFGLPQLSSQRWRETVDKALHISSQGNLPGHISSYQLSVEPGSMLAKLVERGQWSEAEDGLCHEQYSILCEMLSTAGYHHYEISNFALPGYEAIHNSAYWRHVPYVGLGPGAHSMLIIPQSPSAPAPFTSTHRA